MKRNGNGWLLTSLGCRWQESAQRVMRLSGSRGCVLVFCVLLLSVRGAWAQSEQQGSRSAPKLRVAQQNGNAGNAAQKDIQNDLTAETPVLLGERSADSQGAPESVPQVIATSLLEAFHAGGPLMYVIALCSVVMIAFSTERFVILRRGRVVPRAFVSRFLSQLREGQLERAQALELCEANKSPVARVLAHAVAKWGRPSLEIEQAIVDGGEREVNHLRRNIRVLNGVSTISTLLGLLGTVFGMIMTFNKISANPENLGKSEELAAGISVALLTTAAGLTVAIPALIAYFYFLGRVDRLVGEIDEIAHNVVQIISAESLEDRNARRPRIKRPAPGPNPSAVVSKAAVEE